MTIEGASLGLPKALFSLKKAHLCEMIFTSHNCVGSHQRCDYAFTKENVSETSSGHSIVPVTDSPTIVIDCHHYRVCLRETISDHDVDQL